LRMQTISADGVEGWEPRHYRRPSHMPNRCLLFPVAVYPSNSAVAMDLAGPAWFRISNYDVALLDQETWDTLVVFEIDRIKRYPSPRLFAFPSLIPQHIAAATTSIAQYFAVRPMCIG